MKRSSNSKIVMAVMAAAALGASAGAKASTSVHISVGLPAAHSTPVHVQGQPVYPPAVQPVHLPAHAVYGSHGDHHERHYRGGHGGAAACGAPRWHPHVRYMPGQVVWRKGELWVARRISARVWNENSPPEWTPGLWAPAVCG